VVTFQPLAEEFVARTLEAEGVERSLAALAARLAGGNLGRARRLAVGPDGLAFRDVARSALDGSARGAAGALVAADAVLDAAERYRKGLKDALERELAPFLDERGRPEEAYRGAIRRLEERHKRRVKRAERDYLDWVLLAVSAALRDDVVGALGGGPELRINLDTAPEVGRAVATRVRGLAAVEEARAALAEDLNLNPRLVLERAFLQLGPAAA
jgi:DNA polymerase-3 subunit delta'